MNDCLAGAPNPAGPEKERVGGKPLRGLFDSVLEAFSSAWVSLCDKNR